MFYFDLEKINDFVFSDEDERSSSVEITEVQGINEDTKEMETLQKTIHEVKETNDMSNKQTIRYDLFKTMVGLIGDYDDVTVTRANNLLKTGALLTLKNYGFIVEVNDEK